MSITGRLISIRSPSAGIVVTVYADEATETDASCIDGWNHFINTTGSDAKQQNLRKMATDEECEK